VKEEIESQQMREPTHEQRIPTWIVSMQNYHGENNDLDRFSQYFFATTVFYCLHFWLSKNAPIWPKIANSKYTYLLN